MYSSVFLFADPGGFFVPDAPRALAGFAALAAALAAATRLAAALGLVLAAAPGLVGLLPCASALSVDVVASLVVDGLEEVVVTARVAPAVLVVTVVLVFAVVLDGKVLLLGFVAVEVGRETVLEGRDTLVDVNLAEPTLDDAEVVVGAFEDFVDDSFLIEDDDEAVESVPDCAEEVGRAAKPPLWLAVTFLDVPSAPTEVGFVRAVDVTLGAGLDIVLETVGLSDDSPGFETAGEEGVFLDEGAAVLELAMGALGRAPVEDPAPADDAPPIGRDATRGAAVVLGTPAPVLVNPPAGFAAPPGDFGTDFVELVVDFGFAEVGFPGFPVVFAVFDSVRITFSFFSEASTPADVTAVLDWSSTVASLVSFELVVVSISSLICT